MYISLWNAQSVGNKTPTVNDYLREHDPDDLDMHFIVQSWLCDHDKKKMLKIMESCSVKIQKR